MLKEAQQLNVWAYWLQPGSQDSEVLDYIHADSALEAKSLYDEPLHLAAPAAAHQMCSGGRAGRAEPRPCPSQADAFSTISPA